MSAAEPQSLEDLLARCALGDRRAFEKLYRQSSAQLFGLALRIVRQQELASEVLQEAFVKIWQRAGDFRPDKARATTWMGAIVRNQAIDQVRRRGANPVSTEPVEEYHWLADESAGPQETVAQAHRDQALHRCLDELEGEQQVAMRIAYFEGLTHEELAVRMDRPLGTIKSWLRRGLQRLKNCLERT